MDPQSRFGRAGALSAYLRFECSLPLALGEFAIPVTARLRDARYSSIAQVGKAVAADSIPSYYKFATLDANH